jgi:hypothetical protein
VLAFEESDETSQNHGNIHAIGQRTDIGDTNGMEYYYVEAAEV